MWRGILGHDEVVERFRRTLRGGRLASTYLFVGPEGVGKRRLALELAKTMLCQARGPAAGADELEQCGRCESCRLFDAGTHPDLELVGLLPGKSDLAIGQFVGEGDRRNQEGLCHRIALRPFLGGRRVAIIDDADHFNQASANCLLKTLEEPPPHSLLILIGTSLGRQLPTIRSRAQIVYFRPLSPDDLKQVLLKEQIVTDEAAAGRLAELSEGSVARARELADPELQQFRAALVERLSRPAWDVLSAEKAVLDFVQAAGTEASLRRDRLRTLIGFVVEHYRRRMKQGAGSMKHGAKQQEHVVLPAPCSLLPVLDVCLEAVEQVDRNANQSLIISHWLGRIAATEPVAGPPRKT
jgi:DNA polymerase-3 subunit delta'